jgi:hypothetical protein
MAIDRGAPCLMPLRNGWLRGPHRRAMVPARRATQPRMKTAMLPKISRRPIFIAPALAPIGTQDVANGSLRLNERRDFILSLA